MYAPYTGQWCAPKKTAHIRHTAQKLTHLLYLLSINHQSNQPILGPIPNPRCYCPRYVHLQSYGYISWSHVAMQGEIHAHFLRILCNQPNNPPSAGLPLLHHTPPATPPPSPPSSLASLAILSVGHGSLRGTSFPFPLHALHTGHNTHRIRTRTTDHCYPPSKSPPPLPTPIS